MMFAAIRFAAGFGVFLLTANPSPTTSVEVSVSNVRNGNGHVLVAVCPKAEFLSTRCEFVGLAPARKGTIHVRINGIPLGTYAVQAFHDENDNEKVDRNFFGLPTEGMGFSNDPKFHFGPPGFQDAAVSLGPDVRQIEVHMRYYTE